MSEQEATIKIPVVVIDDQISMRKALRRILDGARIFSVEEFSTAKDAIEYLKSHVVELVVSDIYLPKGSGLDVIRYLRQRPLANDVPVIFVTGEATKDDIVHSIELGVNDYLIKPFGAQDLLGKIKTLLSRYRNPSEKVKKLRSAEAALIEGRVEDALRQFKELATQETNAPRVLVGLAQAEAKSGRLDEAFALIDKAINESQIYFPAYAVGADLLLKQGKKIEAIQFILKELAINGKQVHRRMLLADLYFEAGDFKSGLEQMRQALVDSPSDEAALLKMAELQSASGDHEKAIHYYLKTRRKSPSCTRALDGIAQVCLATNTPKRALQLFADFLAQNPMRKDVILVRARLHEKMGDEEQALGDVETFLISESENIEALYLKGRLLLRLNHFGEAKEVWDEICKLSPTSENFAKVGLVNLKMNRFNDAAAFYEKSVSLEPTNPKYLHNLGYAYECLKHFAKARVYYEKLMRVAPQNVEGRDALARLNALAAGRPGGAGAAGTPKAS